VFGADAIECVFSFDACCSIQAFVWRTAIRKFRGIGWWGPCKREKIKKAIDPSVTQFGSINTKRPEKKITILLDSCGNLGVNFVKDRVHEN